jgi:2-polyprenyl-6-methoxyphenol hydroxylase-like FAD-dependent oxidoreductase
MLEEAGGEFMAIYVRVPHINLCLTLLMYTHPFQHGDVCQLLLETARELGAEARTNAEVVEIAQDCRSVRLASGECLQADIIVGADGSQGICRKLLDPQCSLKGSGVMLLKCACCPLSHVSSAF